MLVRIPKGWEIRESRATPESVFRDRRRFLKLTAGGLAAAALGRALSAADAAPPAPSSGPSSAARNPRYTIDQPITPEKFSSRHNVFDEFSLERDQVWKLAERLRTRPWSIHIGGLVEKPITIDAEDLIRKMALEERLYRFRCVEAWAMAVPWSGFALARLLERAEPKGNARYVRFISFADPQQMPGIKAQSWYPWPYYEALRIEEAFNELAFVATGIYGHPLPKQHGAPIRIVTPWKYGYKSAKSVVRIELVEQQPRTFWNDLAPHEYPFQSNVNPAMPHPRWSQATERMLGSFDVRRTLPFNGYANFVAPLYAG